MKTPKKRKKEKTKYQEMYINLKEKKSYSQIEKKTKKLIRQHEKPQPMVDSKAKP